MPLVLEWSPAGTGGSWVVLWLATVTPLWFALSLVFVLIRLPTDTQLLIWLENDTQVHVLPLD